MNDVEQLIIDKLTGQIGEEEDYRLEGLIARHQEVEQLWQQMQQVYAMRKAVSFDQSFNEEAAWLALQQKVHIPDHHLQPQTDTVAVHKLQPNSRWLRYSMAATIAGLIIISVYYFSGAFRSQVAAARSIQIRLANGSIMHTTMEDSSALWMQQARDAHVDPGAWNTLLVPAGKNYAFQLADGSKVWMNAASELKFPLLFTHAERTIELTGEAYFKVAHQPDQPFMVKVNGLSVKALGTEFNIRSYSNEATCIALVKGSVAVENARGEQIILSPGESVMAANGNSPLRKEKFDEVTMLGWMQGLYFFNNEKLQHIAVVAQRWFDVPVKLNNPSLGELHFSGALDRNKPINAFFNMLSSSGDIRYDWKDGALVIYGN